MAGRADRRLLGLIRANQAMMELRPEINASLINAFLGAAISQPTNPEETPPTIIELARFLETPYNSMSRHCRYLSDIERPGKEGAGLVEVRMNPDNRREKLVYLTPQGEVLRDKLLGLLP